MGDSPAGPALLALDLPPQPGHQTDLASHFTNLCSSIKGLAQTAAQITLNKGRITKPRHANRSHRAEGGALRVHGQPKHVTHTRFTRST